jgi:hypothetical protein
MSNDAILNVPRNQRRLLLREEEHRRKRGLWGEWEIINLPTGAGANGWPRDVRQAFRNKVFCVLRRSTSEAVHLAVSSLSGVRPTWHEMQRIKDEIAGPEATAVEVYPPRDEIVDDADMFHLWVLPAPLPFSIWREP